MTRFKWAIDDEAPIDDSCYVTKWERLKRIFSVADDYEVDDTIFSRAGVKEWRDKEKKLLHKYKDSYYRCKVSKAEVYQDF